MTPSPTEAPRLIPLAEATGELELVKESWRKGVHELQSGAGTVARLDYKAWSGRAKAEAADGQWAFSRAKGLLSRTITVTTDDHDVAEFDKNTWTRGGQLELGGRSYTLSAGGLFRPAWSWSHGEQELVTVRSGFSFGEKKGTVELTDAGRQDPHASLLLLLAVHVILTSDSESSSAGGAAAAAG